MHAGDLMLASGKPPAAALPQYAEALIVLQALHGQLHFLVGRAMLAAARCKAPTPAPGASVPQESVKPVDKELESCLIIQHISQVGARVGG